MLEQLSHQSKDKKLQKLADFLVHLSEHLKTTEDFKAENPDREDLNALIELILAIQEEARAVIDLVEIEDDCSEDWEDLEEARGSLSRTLARIGHSNWVAQGPTNSRRFNQLFFHVRGDGESAEGAILVSELLEVSKRLLAEDLAPALQSHIEGLAALLGDDTAARDFAVALLRQLQQLEDFLDLALFDQSLEKQESWLSKFNHLAEAVALGDVEEPYLIRERNLALERLEDLRELASGSPGNTELLAVFEEFVNHLGGLEGSLSDDSDIEGWRSGLDVLWTKLEASHQAALTKDILKCAVCTGEMALGSKRCPGCGAAVLSLEQTRVVESQHERGNSRLLDSLWDTWNQFQCEDIDQEKLLQILQAISKPILDAVEKIDSPSPLLLDFSNKLETFTQLADRDSLERNWPSLIASGRALIKERVSLLKRD